MSLDAFKNFAIGTLTTGMSSTDTSVSLGGSVGGRFPTAPFNAIIWNATDYANIADAYWGGEAEVVRVTTRAPAILTVTRAQEGTSAVNFNTAGKTYRIVAGLTALSLAAVEPAADWGTLSGTTPAIVFTDTPQVLSITTSGNTVFSASGYAQKRRVKLLITADAARTLGWASWTWLECASGGPTNIASGKLMEVDLLCTGSTAASVIATYAVQP